MLPVAPLLLSFLAFCLIPVIAMAAGVAVSTGIFKRSPPKATAFLRDAGVSIAISVGITLVVCGVFRATGLVEALYFRPSNRDYGELAKVENRGPLQAFAGDSGVALSGALLPATTAPVGTVVHFHGSDRNLTYTVRHVAWLTEHGFHVFVFDYRGYGAAEGKPTLGGVIQDGMAAVQHVRSLPECADLPIILWGQSLGGQVAIQSAARLGSDVVDGVIAEATYGASRWHIRDKFAQMGPLWLLQWAGWLWGPGEFEAIPSVGELSPIDLLLIHGTADRVVRPYHSDWLLRASSQPNELWRFVDSKHLDIFQGDGVQERRERLLTHLRGCLKNRIFRDWERGGMRFETRGGSVFAGIRNRRVTKKLARLAPRSNELEF